MNYTFDGCDVTALAEKYQTPLYVISEGMIKERIKILKEGFLHPYENVEVAYASKAFMNSAMIKIIKEAGLSLDVVSGGELFAALHVGFDTQKIFFHGNNKSVEELEMAIKYKVGRIVVDNFHELELLKILSEKHRQPVDILFRINPDVKGKTHASISTGQADSKFGVPLDWAVLKPEIEVLMRHPYLKLRGFHFHIGSQLMNHESHIKAIKVTYTMIERCVKELAFEVEDLNIGGGFGIRYTHADEPADLAPALAHLVETITEASAKLNMKRPRIIIEPGRWIVGEAGITLYTVGAIKQIPYVRNYLSVDGGLGDNIRPALYDAKYHAVIGNKMNQPVDTLYTVAGKCCESGDIIIKDIMLPRADYGDLLVVFSTGAYHYSMSSNYNKLRRPAVVFTENGTHRVVTKRETYEDLLQNDVE